MSKIMSLIIITTAFFIASCGEKSKNSNVKLKIVSSNIMSAPFYGGGILVMGRSEGGEHSFRLGLQNISQGTSLVLPKGKWEFAAISWSGTNGALTGDNRCAYTEMMDLKDNEVAINFNLTATRCLNKFANNEFAHSDFMKATGQFLEFFPIMCMDNNVGSAVCNQATNTSSFLSYKVIYDAEKRGLVEGEVAALTSDCLILTQSLRARIPVTDSTNENPLRMRLNLYPSSDCSGAGATFFFRDGVKNNQLPQWNYITAVPNYYSYVYFNPGTMYDASPAEPLHFDLNGLESLGFTYFDIPVVSYTITSHPANADMMCVTDQASCSNSDWIAPSLSGSVNLSSSADGDYTLKLFYRTPAGVVSSTPLIKQLTVDSTAPIVPSTLSLFQATAASGIDVSWSSSDASVFDYWKIYICSDMGCGTILGTETITTFATQYKHFTLGEITGGVNNGVNYCVRVKAFDKFGRYSMIPAACVMATAM